MRPVPENKETLSVSSQKMGDFNVKNGVVGFEVVPVGDWDRVEWDAGVSGLYLSY